MIYFTADTHFGHYNIIGHVGRPFSTADEMDGYLLDRINGTVGKNDVLWHLGDFSWKDPGPYLDRIVCKDVRVILGNHDRPGMLRKAADRGRITLYTGYVDRKIEGRAVTLCHYPMRSWLGSHRGTWHLHGHCHGTRALEEASLDVGVDAWGGGPASWDEVERVLGDAGQVL